MAVFIRVLLGVAVWAIVTSPSSWAGVVFQGFETSRVQVAGLNGAAAAVSSEQVRGGSRSVKFSSPPPGLWGGVEITTEAASGVLNFEPSRHDRLVFWTYALPHDGSPKADNNILVKFFENGTFKAEVWTTRTAKKGQWTQLTVLFSQLPSELALASVDKLQFINYNPGTYYIDDIQVISADRVYQSFEPGIDEPLIPNEVDKFGWAWFGGVSLLTDAALVKEGLQSWRLDTTGLMGGTGIKSQEKKLALGANGYEQSAWHVDLLGVRAPQQAADSFYDHLSFWVHARPENGMDNNVGIQVYDWQDKYFTAGSFAGLSADAQAILNRLSAGGYLQYTGGRWKFVGNIYDGAVRDAIAQLFPAPAFPPEVSWQVLNVLDSAFVVWTTLTAPCGEWTRFSLPLSDFTRQDTAGNDYGVLWSDVNKVQLQVYWKGTYDIDDIRAARPVPLLDRNSLDRGILRWGAVKGAGSYTLQISRQGPQGPWTTVYEGPSTSVAMNRVSPVWVRVRWQETASLLTNPLPYVSDWSDVEQWQLPLVVISRDFLSRGVLWWSSLPFPLQYRVEQAGSAQGPWRAIYTGANRPLLVLPGGYYRVRGEVVSAGQVVDTGEWSPVQRYQPGQGYLKASGMVLKDQDGMGSVVTLRGVNLGNQLLIEPWMTGILANGRPVPDDWTVRQQLTARFGAYHTRWLMYVYQWYYLNERDMDRIYRSGANFVRLPIYYRAIRDIDERTGAWAAGSYFDFSAVDRVVRWCEDRGIYVLLDLHGAPGGQSKEMHTGRVSAASPAQGYYHRLFDPSTRVYRDRTRELWQAMALRYRASTAVMGYDLVNEPFGAIDPVYFPVRQEGLNLLWSFYSDLYAAIRSVDRRHIIVMEAIPSDKDWDTLPSPLSRGWSNVMYQFHYYGFKLDAGGQIVGTLPPEQQEAYLVSGADPACAAAADDDKFCGKVTFSRQKEYNVPVLIGEFNGFDQRSVWDLFLKTFDGQGWSWAMWSYKHNSPGQQWGWYTPRDGKAKAPDVALDPLMTLYQKWLDYQTVPHYQPGVTLLKILKEYFSK